MIVQPDFLDHWKTNMLVTLLDDPCAPLYVIRLWAHCHNRKTNRFPRGNPSVLKAICHAKQDAELFEKSMCESGFLKIVDGDWIAHDWNVVNAKIMRNWENGKSGGRPKTEGEKPTKKTQTKPTKNPPKTQRKPKRNRKRKTPSLG